MASPSISPPAVSPPTSASPTIAVPTGAAACPADLPNALVDEVHDYRLCLAPDWRILGLGDPGWTEVYGPSSEMEREFRGGRFDHVAVLLNPDGGALDAELIIDSPARGGSDSLESERDSLVSGYVENGAKELSSTLTTVAGREAARVEVDISDMPGTTREGRLLLFFVATDTAVITLRFNSTVQIADTYEPVFDAMAASLRFGGAR
jgi:hypothetical protein